MKNFILIALLLISSLSFAQKDTTITSRKIVVLPDSTFVIQTTETTVKNERISMMSVSRVDGLQAQNEQRILEANKNAEERKELVKLLQDAVKKGYKVKVTGNPEAEYIDKVLKKIKLEKQ